MSVSNQYGPPKLNQELIAEICALISDGAPTKIACRCVGITSDSYYRWRKRGRRDGSSSVYGEFAEAVAVAEAKRIASMVKKIKYHGMKDDWRALAWLLSRLEPEQFPDRVLHEIRTPEELEERIDADSRLSQLSDDELEHLERIAIKLQGNGRAAGALPAASAPVRPIDVSGVPRKLASSDPSGEA